jgi:DNA helicase-4
VARDKFLNPWWLPRLLSMAGPSLRISEKGLTWTATSDTERGKADFLRVKSIRLKRGLISTQIVVQTSGSADGPSRKSRASLRYEFSGYRGSEAEFFVEEANARLASILLDSLAPATSQALVDWDRPRGKDQFMTLPQHRQWLEKFEDLADQVDAIFKLPKGVGSIPAEFARFWDLHGRRGGARKERNAAWVANQKVVHHGLFNGLLGYSLNVQQVDAILNDEHRTLVVAGAGTGKTSTVVAKAKWILEQGLSTETRMKLLAYNRAAAKEINARFGETETEDALASTFHSLGKRIIGEGRGRMPHLTKLGDDDQSLQKFLRACMDRALGDKDVAGAVIAFLAYFRFPEPDPVPTEASHEANRWADGHDIRSFTGVRLRSNSEAIIANWLTLHGIQWEYERPYVSDTTTAKFAQYRPDFFLPEHDVYIEHWASSRDGTLPENWSQQEVNRYRAGMDWKRSLHAKNGTKLLETFSAIDGGVSIPKALQSQLEAISIEVTPINEEARNKILSDAEIIAPVVTLLKNFLSIYKENQLTLTEIRKSKLKKSDQRGHSFLDLFEVVFGEYQSHLANTGTIDYADMIREATEILDSGLATVELDYLLVDEFQDISRGRAAFVRAILAQNPDCRLVAVGDDWQSIYRFAGSDIGVMVEFEQIYGDTQRVDLTQTHRFGTSTLQATSKFIQENPQQLRKSLTAARADDGPSIEIISSQAASKSVIERAAVTTALANLTEAVPDVDVEIPADNSHLETQDPSPQSEAQAGTKALGDVFQRIAAEAPEASVLVLGRYRFLERRLKDQGKIPGGLKASFSTVHKAKGLEADFVVIADVITDKYGFPKEIEDDPLMNLVLATEQKIANAEERRLFYVAATRARRRTYILTDDHRRSQFVDELEKPDYRAWVLPSEAGTRVADCPLCGGGRLKLRVGKFGPFYGCSSTRCRGKAFRCPSCRDAGLVQGDREHKCLFCGKNAQSCPKCGVGYVRQIPAGVSSRTGRKYGAFNACSTNTLEPEFLCWTENKRGIRK